jgi:CheY-like chemotaxis protein
MNKPRILVVDDDGPILLLMRSLLREFGYEPMIASSGVEALRVLEAEAPALVLLDRNMPGGMGGDDVVRAIRAQSRLADVPVLILSGEPMHADELRAMGADGSIQKPFDITALLDEIRSRVGDRVSPN